MISSLIIVNWKIHHLFRLHLNDLTFLYNIVSVDGKYVVTEPMDLLKSSASFGIDMMYGCTGNEVVGFLSSDPFGMNPENNVDKYISSNEVMGVPPWEK